MRLYLGTTLLCLVLISGVVAQETPFHAEVEVTRIVIEVRVVDHDGTPVQGLGPEDFQVSVDGTPAQVETVDWFAAPLTYEIEPGSRDLEPEPTETIAVETRGRLIVMLYQIGLDFVRIKGVYRIDDYAREFLRSLHPSDRVAVMVFGSHLQLHADFTNDFEELEKELVVTEVIKRQTANDDGREPSLARHIDLDRAKRATDLRQALHVIGDAMTEIPGTKSIVLLGYGIGDYHMSQGRVWLGEQYLEALEALSAARASVYSLDITSADHHSLEVGLQKLSRDTGGFYMKTHIFPEVAVDKLARTLSGHYELSILPPPELGENFRVKIRVKIPGTEVHFRRVQFPGS